MPKQEYTMKLNEQAIKCVQKKPMLDAVIKKLGITARFLRIGSVVCLMAGALSACITH